jgi:hypothetical protein
VIRRAANLGATYPDIVSILESAERQKNLPGPLVVDAVPNSNTDYLQAAILGKDSTAKVDPALQRAAAQASPSRLRRLFGLRNRDLAETASSQSAPTPDPSRSATNKESNVKDSSAASTAGPTQVGSDPNKGGTGTSDAEPGTGPETTPKKDDGLQRAGGETVAPPRSRLLDWFRRRSQ